MKKIILKGSMLLLVAFTILNCGKPNNEIASDAKKLAALQCKAQELSLKAGSGDISAMTESLKLTGEAIEFSSKMIDKYQSEGEYQKFSEVLEKELKKCQ